MTANSKPASRRPDRVVRQSRDVTVEQLFPPPGHRYFTDEQIEALRQRALPGDDVTLTALEVMQLICDWRNMAADLQEHLANPTAERCTALVGPERVRCPGRAEPGSPLCSWHGDWL